MRFFNLYLSIYGNSRNHSNRGLSFPSNNFTTSKTAATTNKPILKNLIIRPVIPIPKKGISQCSIIKKPAIMFPTIPNAAIEMIYLYVTFMLLFSSLSRKRNHYDSSITSSSTFKLSIMKSCLVGVFFPM